MAEHAMNQPAQDENTSTSREDKYAEFVGLLARHDNAIRRFVRSLLPSNEGVDDILQETALECWKKFGEFSPQCNAAVGDEFARWACVIARFKAMSWQRDRSRDRLVFRENVIERLATKSLEHIDLYTEERSAVERCLEKMDNEQRSLVLSVYSPGKSVVSIAAQSGEKTRRLYGKLNALRKQLLDCVKQQITLESHHG